MEASNPSATVVQEGETLDEKDGVGPEFVDNDSPEVTEVALPMHDEPRLVLDEVDNQGGWIAADLDSTTDLQGAQ